MIGNGKIFISHTHEDNARCAPLLAALDAWGVDYWFDVEQLAAGQHISERVQQAISERDVFIRIGTASSRASLWTTLELAAFRGLQLDAKRERRAHQRQSITLILDSAYSGSAPIAAGVSDHTDVLIDATGKTQPQWLAELRNALGLDQRRGISRRAAIGLAAAGALTLGAAATGGLIVKERIDAAIPYPKPKVIPFTNPQTSDPRIAWFYVAGSEEPSAIALAQGVLYVNSSEGLAALDAADGTTKWMNDAVNGSPRSLPVVAGTTVYAGGSQGNLFALNAADGTGLWSVQAGDGVYDPAYAVVDTTVFVLGDDGTIGALRASDGSVLWKGPNMGGWDSVQYGIAADASAVYVPSTKSAVVALNAADGSTKWTYQTGGQVLAAPTLANGAVYFGSADQHVYAVSAADGSLLWRYPFTSGISVSPTVANSVAYIGLGTNLVALDANTGALLWQVAAPDLFPDGNADTFDFIATNVAVAGNMVYVVNGPMIYAFSANQPTKAAWHFQSTGPGFQTPPPALVGDGLVYFANIDQTVYALHAL